MWYQNRFFKYATATLLVLLIFFLLPYVTYLFRPIYEFISALFFPLILTSILYYVLRPVIRWMSVHYMRGTFAILTVYLGIFIIILLFTSYIVPVVADQISILTALSTQTFEDFKEKTADFVFSLPFDVSVDELKGVITSYLYQLNILITNNIVSTFAAITRFTITLVITPFILYYFLKDDSRLYMNALQVTPKQHRDVLRILLTDIDFTLSTYIRGQLLVSFCMGMLLLVGYWGIGLKSAVVLALFAMVAVVIPFFGIFIAMIPAVIVGLPEGPWMVSKVIIVIMTAQAIEANLVSPQIMSQRLHLHPLTVMLLLLASGSLYGVVGLFLATPIYAVVKAIGFRLYNMYYLNEEEEAAGP